MRLKSLNILILAIVIILAQAGYICPAVAAESDVLSVEASDGGFEIILDAEPCSSFASLMILYPNAKLPDTEYDVNVRAEQQICDARILEVSDGHFEFYKYIGNKGPFGAYTIRVNYGKEVYSADFRYTKNLAEYKEELRQKLNEGGNITEILKEYRDITLIDIEKTDALSKELAEYFEAELKKLIPVTDIDEFLKNSDSLMETVFLISDINSAENTEELAVLFKSGVELLGITFDLEDEHATEFLTEIFNELPYNSVGEFAALNKRFALHKLNSSSWGAYYELIKKYASDDIDIKKLDSLTSSQQDSLFKELALGAPFESYEAFIDKYNRAYSNASASPSKPVSSGGSSGGGGGGSRQSIVSPSQEQPEIIPEPERISFDDLDGFEWAQNEIYNLVQTGAISGKGDNKFAPGDNVTREEFIKIMLNALGFTVKSGIPDFSDVGSGEWYVNYVYTAYSLEIVSGISEELFGTGKAITRQDAAVMLYRAVKSLNKFIDVTPDCGLPADADKIADYASDAVNTMYRAGVLKGNGNGEFMPEELMTRAQAAVMINNILGSVR